MKATPDDMSRWWSELKFFHIMRDCTFLKNIFSLRE